MVKFTFIMQSLSFLKIWLRWVFVALGAFCSWGAVGCSWWWLLLLRSAGFTSCSMQAHCRFTSCSNCGAWA